MGTVAQKEFDGSLSMISTTVFIYIYCGYLSSFVSRFSEFSLNGKDVSNSILAVFLLMVFMCDSIAWFFGVLLGKNNRGFFAASPNKSLIGFFGGFVGSVGAGLLCRYIWPEIFVGSVLKIIFTGIAIALSAIVGDLAESVLKRSTGFKDSGNIIPGRGGMLDSIDSLLLSAPVFYLLVSIFYGPFVF